MFPFKFLWSSPGDFSRQAVDHLREIYLLRWVGVNFICGSSGNLNARPVDAFCVRTKKSLQFDLYLTFAFIAIEIYLLKIFHCVEGFFTFEIDTGRNSNSLRITYLGK